MGFLKFLKKPCCSAFSCQLQYLNSDNCSNCNSALQMLQMQFTKTLNFLMAFGRFVVVSIPKQFDKFCPAIGAKNLLPFRLFYHFCLFIGFIRYLLPESIQSNISPYDPLTKVLLTSIFKHHAALYLSLPFAVLFNQMDYHLGIKAKRPFYLRARELLLDNGRHFLKENLFSGEQKLTSIIRTIAKDPAGLVSDLVSLWTGRRRALFLGRFNHFRQLSRETRVKLAFLQSLFSVLYTLLTPLGYLFFWSLLLYLGVIALKELSLTRMGIIMLIFELSSLFFFILYLIPMALLFFNVGRS